MPDVGPIILILNFTVDQCQIVINNISGKIYQKQVVLVLLDSILNC